MLSKQLPLRGTEIIRWQEGEERTEGEGPHPPGRQFAKSISGRRIQGDCMNSVGCTPSREQSKHRHAGGQQDGAQQALAGFLRLHHQQMEAVLAGGQ
jgi:hypothetical protein